MILVLSLEVSLVFLHARGKLTASVAHIGAETLRARDAIHDIPPSFMCTSVVRRDSVGLWVMVRL